MTETFKVTVDFAEWTLFRKQLELVYARSVTMAEGDTLTVNYTIDGDWIAGKFRAVEFNPSFMEFVTFISDLATWRAAKLAHLQRRRWWQFWRKK